MKLFVMRSAALVLLLALTGCQTTPLMHAVRSDDNAAVLDLLNKGANPNEAVNLGPINTHPQYMNSPLIVAAWRGNVVAMKALIDKGADVNAKGGFGGTPLSWAARNEHLNAVKLLLDRGAVVDDVAGEIAADYVRRDYWGDGHACLSCVEIVKLIKQAQNKQAGLADASPPAPAPQAAPAAPPAEAKAVDSDVDAPSYHAAENPDDFALVIGIAKYRDLPEAEFADRDAAAVKKHLLALGYPERNIVALTGDRATKSTLTEKLEKWLPLNVNENSTVFVYYSGHGAPDPAQGTAYLVPWDGDPAALEDTAYPVKRLYEKLGALKAKRVIVALDSCFSGAGGRSVLAKGARPLVSKIDLGEIGSDKITTLTASGPDQISGAIDGEGHGAFTYFLLKGLNGAAADDGGHVTLAALFKYLKPRVQDEAHRRDGEQTPQFKSSDVDAAGLRLR